MNTTEGASRALLSLLADRGGRKVETYWGELHELGVRSYTTINALARAGLVEHETIYLFGTYEVFTLTPAGWAALGREPRRPWWRRLLP